MFLLRGTDKQGPTSQSSAYSRRGCDELEHRRPHPLLVALESTSSKALKHDWWIFRIAALVNRGTTVEARSVRVLLD